jgi:hypothetical protein
MRALDALTAADFAPHLHERFRLQAGAAGELPLELVEVVGGEHREQRRPFSVVFRGPGDPVLPQQIYGIEHPALGTLELFLVPIGRDAAGVSYEAVFN